MSVVNQLEWEKKSTVRTRPRLLFEAGRQGYFFPRSRQPLSIHPLIEDLGSVALDYLLTQSFYKYANDIAIIETRVVNQTILRVMSDELVIDFSVDQKINLYTIMVDEAYHAYVAYDAIQQIQQHTDIKPFMLPKTIEIELAIYAVKNKLAPLYHALFELIVVCLAENTLTKDMLSMLDQEETHPFFQQLIHAHFSDETRHAGVFFHLLKDVWCRLPRDYKQSIGAVLPEFLTLYLGVGVQTAFEKHILVQLGLKSHEVDLVLMDTYFNFQVTRHHPMLKNILIILEKAGVLDEDVAPFFKKLNWI